MHITGLLPTRILGGAHGEVTIIAPPCSNGAATLFLGDIGTQQVGTEVEITDAAIAILPLCFNCVK